MITDVGAVVALLTVNLAQMTGKVENFGLGLLHWLQYVIRVFTVILS